MVDQGIRRVWESPYREERDSHPSRCLSRFLSGSNPELPPGEEYAVSVGDRFPTEIDGAALSVRFDRIQLPLVLFTTMSSRSVASIPFRLNPVTKALDLCRSSGAASAPTSLVLLHA